MRLIQVFLSGLSCLSAVFVGAQQESENVPLPSISPSEKQFFQTFVEGNNRFAFDVYQGMKNRPGNFCFSSYSIATGLGMPAIGAKGATANQFQHAFHYSLSLLPLAGDLNELLQTPSSNAKNASQAWLANALWVQKDVILLPFFKLSMQRNFKVPVQPVDFANESGKTLQLINQWVSQQTKGKINSLLSGQDLKPTTRLVLTTAFYLKGQWAQLFDPRQTKRLPFRLTPQRTVLTEMMHQTSTYLLTKGDKWDLIVLPYVQGDQGAQLALVILLPKTITLEELEKDFTLDHWVQWLGQAHMQTVSLTLPRFRIEERLDLSTLSKSMGLSLLFTPEADFSGMTAEKNIFVNKAVHKTMLHIDESGSDSSSVMSDSKPKGAEKSETPYEFMADHAFLFMVWDQKTYSILLMGRLAMP